MKAFVIAGEASGDSLGAPLIKALREAQPEINIQGIGGPQMKAAGMDVLLPMDQLSVMGLLEVVPKLPHLYQIYKATLAEIVKQKPDVLITIDLPDFNFRIAKAVKKLNLPTKIIHYVAPTVWAWRPGRAKKVAQFLDGLICLFPFEPQYFKPHKLDAIYTGHPMIEGESRNASGQTFREKNNIPAEAKTLGLLFGSRKGELASHADTIKAAARIVSERMKKPLHMIVPTTSALEFEVLKMLEDFPCKTYVTADQERKWNAFAACDAAISVSGTAGLELAYANVPHVITYKTNPVTYQIARRLVKVDHAHLANIILKREVVPEYLQGDCEPVKIADGVAKLYEGGQGLELQKKGFAKLKEILEGKDEKMPSQKAAAFILSKIQ